MRVCISTQNRGCKQWAAYSVRDMNANDASASVFEIGHSKSNRAPRCKWKDRKACLSRNETCSESHPLCQSVLTNKPA